MTRFLERLADNWASALYEKIREPLDQFAAKTHPSRRLDWYHDEPRWIFRWNKGSLTQLEVRLEPSAKFPSAFQVLLVAGRHEPDVGWKTKVVDIIDLLPYAQGKFDTESFEKQLEKALASARSLDPP